MSKLARIQPEKQFRDHSVGLWHTKSVRVIEKVVVKFISFSNICPPKIDSEKLVITEPVPSIAIEA
jgi:hypothetical protein